MKRLSLVLTAAGFFCAHAISHAQETAPATPAPDAKAAPDAAAEDKHAKPDYIRFIEEDKTARLETAICRFTGKDGLEVDLVGVVHIGDKTYYQEIDRRLGADYDAVLYELVGDPDDMAKHSKERKEQAAEDSAGEAAEKDTNGEAKKTDGGAAEKAPDEPKKKRREKPSGLAALQKKMAEVLQLDFQLFNIDYSRESFVHADMTWDQFAEMQEKKGESFFQLFLRSLRAQSDPEMAKIAQSGNISPMVLVKLLLNRDVSNELKMAMGKMFDQSEKLMSLIEGEKGSVILTGRNKVASAKLGEIIKTGKKRIAIFYGAGHLPGLEELMIKDHGLTSKDTQWLAAWTITKPQKKAGKK